jgi:hypothetical protein
VPKISVSAEKAVDPEICDWKQYCQIFLGMYNGPKWGKYTKMAIEIPKWQQKYQNGNRNTKMAIEIPNGNRNTKMVEIPNG